MVFWKEHLHPSARGRSTGLYRHFWEKTTSLPALPARAVFLAIISYLMVFLMIIPFYLSQARHRIMNETIEQAVFLSTIDAFGGLQRPIGVRETHALPISGIIHYDSQTGKRVVWLSRQAPSHTVSAHFDLSHSDIIANLQASLQIFMGDSKDIISLRNTTLAGAQNIEVLATKGVFQSLLLAMMLRLGIAMLILLAIVALLFRIVFGRAMLLSLNDFFGRIYGGKVVAAEKTSFWTSRRTPSVGSFQSRLQQHVDEQARLASLGAGAGYLAHDVRNLLTSLQLIADRLETLPGETEQKLAKRLAGSVQRALILVDWAAMYNSHKRDNITPQQQLLADIIDEVLGFVRLHDPNHKVTLVNDCDVTITVMAERTLLFRAIYNLSLNAVQAMKHQKGTRLLRIAAQADDGQCLIRIMDTGPGLPPHERDTLFERKIKWDNHNKTGLGMKIAADLIRWHGGQINLAGSDEAGTHFVITLPHKANKNNRNHDNTDTQ